MLTATQTSASSTYRKPSTGGGLSGAPSSQPVAARAGAVASKSPSGVYSTTTDFDRQLSAQLRLLELRYPNFRYLPNDTKKGIAYTTMYARSDGTIENTNLYPGLSTANPTVDDFVAYYTSPNMLQNIAHFGTPQELVNMAKMSEAGGEQWVPTITSGNWQYNPVYGVNTGMMSTPQPAAGMGLAYGQQPSGTSRLGTLPSTGWGGAGSTKETAKSTYSYSGGNQGAASEVMSAIFAAALPEAPSQRRYFESYMSPIWSEFIYNYLKGGGLPGRSNAYMREGGGAVNAGDYSQWSTLGANEQESLWSEWIKNYPFADEFYSRTAKERGSSPQHSEFSPRTNWIGF